MQYLGVIGYPIKKSLSPVFQQAALDHLRLPIVYQSWPTPEDGLETRVNGMRAPAVLGGNVTIPHKEAVLPLMDEVDDLVRRIGAVNTIIHREGRLFGYNTDAVGFLRGLTHRAQFDPAGRRVVVAGAGGAARAVVVALADAGAESITVINRTSERASRLIDGLRAQAGRSVLTAMPDEIASWEAAMEGCELLVNCTSVGSSGTAEESDIPVPVQTIHSGMLVYDLIYRPAETPLMLAAQERGARVLGGLPMLIYQGAASFEIWTEREAPIDIMFHAAEEALAAEGGDGR